MRRICLGRVGGYFGLRGWIKIQSYTSPATNLLDYQPWWLNTRDGWVEIVLEDGQGHGKGLIVKFPECANREQASRFVGKNIEVARDQLPEPEEDEFYWTDLIGLTVNTLEGVKLGQVLRLIETGSNDVLVVNGERERLIPLLWDNVVIRVEIEKGIIVVDWDPDF